jgi:hypothetical protein
MKLNGIQIGQIKQKNKIRCYKTRNKKKKTINQEKDRNIKQIRTEAKN